MILIIFGATGNLFAHKLLPALFSLFHKKMLPPEWCAVGIARRGLSSDEFRAQIREWLLPTQPEAAELQTFTDRLYFRPVDVRDAAQFTALAAEIETLRPRHGLPPHYLFYLATSPALYPIIPERIAAAGLASPSHGWCRLVIEKPFGHDLNSAQRLDTQLLRHFSNEQLFRIDHYLGKETVQNLLVFRFGNGIFEPLWNRQYIHHIEITAVEDMGITGRGGYYDHAGALRDMVQNHLMQLLALVTMEPPIALRSEPLHDEWMRVLSSLRPISEADVSECVVRGQYLSGMGRGGVRITHYREEPDVAPDSRTETYVALRLHIDNWRWSGTPIYIRTGKAMPTKVSEIVIHFKPAPICLFSGCLGAEHLCQRLTLRIQPDEGIQLQFALKHPSDGSSTFALEPVTMDFQYAQHDKSFWDAYERLLLDCIRGDRMLFARSDAVEATWRFFSPLLSQFQDNHALPLHGYPAGTWGPPEADRLLPAGDTWSNPCKNLTHTDKYCLL